MALSVDQLLTDAKRLADRLKDHERSADLVISSAQSALKEVEALKQYQEDVESLNAIGHNRPRSQLVLGIQQENRHLRQLQLENKELRAALEDYHSAIELIMSKYRHQMSHVIRSSRVESIKYNGHCEQLLQQRADKICEMASVMNQSIHLDEDNDMKQQEFLSRLITENKGLREILGVAHGSGSLSGDSVLAAKMVSRGCQTEGSCCNKADNLSWPSGDTPNHGHHQQLPRDPSLSSDKADKVQLMNHHDDGCALHHHHHRHHQHHHVQEHPATAMAAAEQKTASCLCQSSGQSPPPPCTCSHLGASDQATTNGSTSPKVHSNHSSSSSDSDSDQEEERRMDTMKRVVLTRRPAAAAPAAAAAVVSTSEPEGHHDQASASFAISTRPAMMPADMLMAADLRLASPAHPS